MLLYFDRMIKYLHHIQSLEWIKVTLSTRMKCHFKSLHLDWTGFQILAVSSSPRQSLGLEHTAWTWHLIQSSFSDLKYYFQPSNNGVCARSSLFDIEGTRTTFVNTTSRNNLTLYLKVTGCIPVYEEMFEFLDNTWSHVAILTSWQRPQLEISVDFANCSFTNSKTAVYSCLHQLQQ